MSKPINKEKLLEIVIAIEVKTERSQALIKVMKLLPDTPNNDTLLLDIINDYTDQILERTGELSDGIRELF